LLFCDLVGFTAASDAADPEDVDRVLAGYFRLARAQIEAHGGVVEKFIGDAVVGVFGVPAAREDDPERAVRAGLRICEGAGELKGLGGGLLALRVGVNTGVALVRLGVSPASGEGFVTGDAVNTAARLQSAAPVGGVAAGWATYEATKRIFEYEELEPAELKGKVEPVRVFRPLAGRARIGVDLTRTHDSPFVGRRSELEALLDAFDRALARRSVEMVTVIGEPGIGKSRLVGELSSHVDQRHDLYRWRQGRCLPYGDGIAFWALGEVVKAHAGILESDPPDLAREKLERVLPESDERPWLRERLLPLLGIETGSAGAREESYAAWGRFLGLIAADRPTVMVFEDLHWAGEEMLAFLDHLAEYAAAVPLLVVCTTRPVLYDRCPDQGAGTARIRLSPLSEAETGQLVAGLLEAAVLPAELQLAIRERAGGNPLFTQEFVALLRDRDLIVQRGPSWEFRDAADVPLPDSVQAVIAARLDTLEPEAKSLLGDAAVIGKVFWDGAVSAMGGRDPLVTATTLGELVRRELIAPARRPSMAGEAEYAFGHAVVRDVAYEQLPRPARAARHQAAATWIEAKVGGRVEDFADVLAHHYATALELARAADDTERTATLQAPAIRFLRLAGERTLGLDTAKAMELLERARSLTPAGDPAAARIQLRWAEAVEDSGGFAEAGEALEQAAAQLEAQGDAFNAGQAWSRLGFVYRRLGRTDFLPLHERAVALLEPTPGPELVDALSEYVDGCMISPREAWERGIVLADRARALAAELGLPEPGWALGGRGSIRVNLGDPGGVGDLERAIALLEDAGDRRVVKVMGNLANARVKLEGPAAGIAAVDRVLAVAAARGMVATLRFSGTNRASYLMQTGALMEALDMYDALLPEAREGSDQILMRNLLYGRLRALLELGADATAAAAELAECPGVPPVSRLLVALARRDDDAIAEVLEQLASERPPVVDPPIVRAAAALGDAELVSRLTAGAPEPLPAQRHTTFVYRAVEAELACDYPAAAGAYAEAAACSEDFGHILEQAYSLLGQGRCLARTGDPVAEQPLREARALFEQMRARPRLAEVDALLKQATALSA
jgi:class 3 adenylate cyclase/tetratricopeptide (TPR) repeat protein